MQAKAALFDFDGTLSLIRRGWRDVMVEYFSEELVRVQPGRPHDQVRRDVGQWVDDLTGLETIFQARALAERIAAAGGHPRAPEAYKEEYLRRLRARIEDRIAALEEGRVPAETYLVPGAVSLLSRLRGEGIRLFLASGTDDPDVRREARLLGLEEWFDGGIYGARDELYRTDCGEPPRSLKERVVADILSREGLAGQALVGFGDGFVEISVVKAAGGRAVGVASDEEQPGRRNRWKEERLRRAGADVIVSDLTDAEGILLWIRTGRLPREAGAREHEV